MKYIIGLVLSLVFIFGGLVSLVSANPQIKVVVGQDHNRNGRHQRRDNRDYKYGRYEQDKRNRTVRFYTKMWGLDDEYFERLIKLLIEMDINE